MLMCCSEYVVVAHVMIVVSLVARIVVLVLGCCQCTGSVSEFKYNQFIQNFSMFPQNVETIIGGVTPDGESA